MRVAVRPVLPDHRTVTDRYV